MEKKTASACWENHVKRAIDAGFFPLRHPVVFNSHPAFEAACKFFGRNIK